MIGVDRGRRLESAGKDWDATTVRRREQNYCTKCRRALPWSLAPVAVRVKRGSVTEEMIPLMRVGISSEKVEEEEEEGEVELL